MHRPIRTVLLAASVATLALSATACSSDDGDVSGGTGASGPGTTTTESARGPEPRPDGPSADLSEELAGGGGVFMGAAASSVDLDDAGWVEHEYVAAGTATSYEGEMPADGRAELTETEEEGEYRTRILVRRPADEADFSGTVVVEWLNVSGGLDANPDYAFTASELVRQGTAWVGVSAQQIGVEGGEVAVSTPVGGELTGKGLKGLDPERYGSLEHPGDAFSYDIYTQVGRALRGEAGSGAMGGFDVERLLAVGESQSAFALTTYVNGIQPSTRAFDGFLIHSRGGATMPLGEPGEAVDIAATIAGSPVRIRTDQRVPVLVLETETDVVSVIGYHPARQPDDDHLRVWEVAGTAHADATLLGPIRDSVDCGVPVNDGPQQYAVRAALRALALWVADGTPPPAAEPLEVEDGPDGLTVVRDDLGIAKGGIRFPQVDVPVDVLSGDPGPSGGVICLLLGSTTPIPVADLADRYPSVEAYRDAYEEATDAVIEAGFAVAEDRRAILDEADPSRLGS